MKNLWFVLFLTFNFTSLKTSAQSTVIINDFSDFQQNYLNNRSNDTIYVYNFWATWCKPCVQELPYFDSLNDYNGETPIKLTLVSLDFKSQIESRLLPFIAAQQIRNEVVVLTDGNVNSWIDKVDSSWSGAIPATLIFKGQKKLFYEKTYHSYEEVLQSILQIMKL
jgi:thiol-disulfide isomerase/thioredoxin